MIMPTYEYSCTSCGFEFEEFQSIAAEPLSQCPKCKSRVQRKISGGTGLIFKGTGFYITDYKKGVPDSDSSTPKPKSKNTDKTKSPEK
jgi:putative FmdB family regulatory protein